MALASVAAAVILAGYAIKALVVSKCHWCRHPAVIGASLLAGGLLWIDILR